ncbi:MAG: hypothetical protein ACHQIK_01230 [Candidatus Acidiferrales bacterium]
MPTNPPNSFADPASHSIVYQLAFVKKCHEILGRGYQKLQATTLHEAQETEITGELVKSMKQFLESADAPPWTTHFFVADDPPQNAPGRLGKQRRRVDIEFEHAQHGPRPHLHFEAKRLHKSGSVAEYLGDDGLLLFVNGEYAPEQNVGAMLGYVQEKEPTEWIEQIRASLTDSPERYGFHLVPGLVKESLTVHLAETHRSHHDRVKLSRSMGIYHTFLQF